MQCLSFSAVCRLQCHMHSPLPETFLKPEGCNLLLLGFMARYNYHCDHVVQMWLSSQPHPLIMQREPAPPYFLQRALAGRVVCTNPTNFLWIRPCKAFGAGGLWCGVLFR